MRAVLFLLGLLLSTALPAHEPAPANATRVLDKAAQHRLGLRTQRLDTPARPVLWPARVVADPQQRLRLMADQPGLLLAPPGGFPVAGSRVQAGQLLARLRPTLSDPERRDLEAEWEAAKRAVALGRLQIQRYSIDEAENLEVRLLTPSVQILLDYRAAQAREAQLAQALSGELLLRAPDKAYLLSSSARENRVVAAGEAIFELSAEHAVLLEAEPDLQAFEAQATGRGVDARGQLLSLDLVAQGFDARTRNAQLWYRPQALPASEPLLVGESAQLLLMPRLPAGRYRLPASSVFRQDGQDYIWLHEAPERFRAQRVAVLRRETGSLQIAAASAPEARVVTDAALLQTRGRP